MQNPLITIGIIFGKNDLKYLPYSLKSIFAQTYQNFEVRMHNNILNENDTKADNEVYTWIEKNYPQIKLERSGNIGFGAAHNSMIRQMQGEYYLCYNPDLILESDFLEKLVSFLKSSKEKNIGVIGGEIMYWDFAKRDTESQGKTNQIDSLGLQIRPTHRFIDIGQGSVLKQKDLATKKTEEIFGLSGALFLAKKEALEKIAYPLSPQEYFDETIFLYKEDVDLAYRLRLAGYKTFIIQDAIAYHDRSVSGDFGIINSRSTKKRVVKGQSINTWSFYHHHILLYKNWQKGFGLKTKLQTFFYEVASNLYLLLFEFNTFSSGWKLFRKNFAEIKKRKKITIKKTTAAEIEKWMNK